MGRVAAALLVLGFAFPLGAQTPGQIAPPRQPVTPRDNPATPTGTAVIRGRITSTTGQPLRRAIVVVAANDVAVRRIVTTDDEGRYQFSDVPQGRYTVTASKGSFVTLQYGQRRPFEPGRPVAVANGQVLERVDVSLPSGSVITGTITDEFGEPLASAQVEVQRYQFRPDGRHLLTGIGGTGFVRTDDRGQFRAFGLMPGEYIVSASASMPINTMASAAVRDGAEGYATTFYPGTTNADEAQGVTVGLGEEKPLAFSVRSVATRRISGTVTDSQGRPAVGANVTISIATGAGYRVMFGTSIGTDGSFTAANIPPGAHHISVSGPSRGPGEPPEYATVPVTLGATDAVGLKITTAPPATISGTIVFDGSAPRTGPMPIRVNATRTSDDPGGGVFFFDAGNGMADAEGRFEIRGITGSVLLRPSLPQQWMMRSVTLDGAVVTDEALDPVPQRAITGVVITLTDRVTDVAGTVTSARGEAVKEFAVVLQPAEPKVGIAQNRYLRVGRPDQEGRFDVRGLPPGDYYATAVEALEQTREWDPEYQGTLRTAGRSFTLREGESVTLQLKLADLP